MSGSPAAGTRLQPSGIRGRRAVAAYFALTFLGSWSLWLAVGGLAMDALPPAARQILLLPGIFMPSIVAIAMSARASGASGVRALLRPLGDWRVGAHLYAFAAFYMILVKLIAAAAHRALTGAWPPFGTVPLLTMLAATLASWPVQAGEEIGWRGFALPRLASIGGLPLASVILGVVWAAWHLPLFVIAGTSTTGQPFTPYLLSVTALSVAMAWLWSSARGSLLLVTLMHAAINNTKDVVPSAVAGSTTPSPVSWLTGGVLWAFAAGFLVLMMRRGRGVSRRGG
jgi:membrane protease YdiL (CAAX protease family)